jgi:hypothetical protein
MAGGAAVATVSKSAFWPREAPDDGDVAELRSRARGGQHARVCQRPPIAGTPGVGPLQMQGVKSPRVHDDKRVRRLYIGNEPWQPGLLARHGSNDVIAQPACGFGKAELWARANRIVADAEPLVR